MQKLGHKGTTEEGLMDLHQYMQRHPHLKLDQIMNLSVASSTFRKYLEDGLRKAAYRARLAKGGEHAQNTLCEGIRLIVNCCSPVIQGHNGTAAACKASSAA